MTIKITLLNERQILQGIDQLETVLGREMVTGVNRATKKILSTAKRNAPVDTGQLRDSGSRDPAAVKKSGLGGTSVVGAVEFSAPYAVAVEYGKGRGNHYLRSAIDRHEGGRDDIAAAIGRAVGAV